MEDKKKHDYHLSCGKPCKIEEEKDKDSQIKLINDAHGGVVEFFYGL